MTDDCGQADLHDGWDECAWKFKEYCEGFEHLCAGVLKLKNYCGQSDERLIKGLSEIFEEIKEKLG